MLVEKCKMTIISHRLETSASPAALWRNLSNLTRVQTYNPSVVSARLQGEQRSGVGTLRECEVKPKGAVLERVNHWEEGKAIGLEIVKSDWPITSMSWITRIEPNGRGSTLSQQLQYEMKFGPFGRLLNALIMKRNISRNVDLALRGLIALTEKLP
jgi:Polyketide cyclase / dehydrase and lipid transport